jgi:predicted dehydrogenase
VCDAQAERARQAGKQYNAEAFSTAGELFSRARPEVLSIATHPSSHLSLTLQALEAGCHVLCEKPVAMNAAQAWRMVQAAQRAGRLLSICFEYRYWDESLYLRERLARGDLGRVYAVRTWGGGVHNFPLSPAYHRQASAGGGALTHWTIHNLDLALCLLGHPEPLRASAFCHQRLRHLPPEGLATALKGVQPTEVDPRIEDFALGLVRLEGDVVIAVEANYLQPPSARPEGWEFWGERGAASISPIRVWLDQGDCWLDDTPPPGTLAPCDYHMERLIKGFLEAVRAGGPAPVSGAEILRIQRLMDALYKSAAQGREVEVEKALNH